MAAARRVVIIGWDCAPPQFVLGPYLEHMPNLRALVDDGVAGLLRSTDPPITVPAWTCMMSSVNPGQLGFFGFRNRRVGEYDGKWIANSSAVKVPRVWDLLSDAGRSVCVLNVPQTYPVSQVNGVMVSSFLTPDTSAEYTYPSGLKEQIERIADGYMIDVEGFRTEDKRALLEQIYEMTDKRFKVATALMQVDEWDFFMMVEMGPDRLEHGFWKYCDPAHPKYEPGNEFETAMLDYYVHLDGHLGRLIELAGDDAAVLVVSDHGGKAMQGSFCINDWLIQEGLLTLKAPVDTVTRFEADLVDWERTTAWAWGGYYGRVFLNVAGREPQGIVAPEDYERVRDELIERIKAVPDHRGWPMNTRVVRPEDVYTGPYVKDAPDLQVYMDDLNWRLGQDIGHEELYTFDTEIGPDDSVHDYCGMIAARAPGDSRLALGDPSHLMDVAPTVLDLLGEDIPDHMEGRSLLQ
ncbi:MAG: alkaline phosphatase family protein [Armatimonadetes bacterium]|nr:alkaline phosphatase family protein [Armatimonadota bacterium]